MKGLLRAVAVLLALGLTQLVSCVAVSSLVIPKLDAREIRPVGPKAPDQFPIVVVTRTSSGQPSATVIFNEKLAEFLSRNPDASYLIPLEHRDQLRAAIEAFTRSHGIADAPLDWATFEVRALGNGRQELQVEGRPDDDIVNTGWYEATDKTFIPLRHRFYFGPGMGLGFMLIVVPVAVVLNLAGWLLGFRILRRRRRGSSSVVSRT